MPKKVVYPQWFLDELAHEEDRIRAINGELRTKERVDFICKEHGVYNQKIIDHIVKGEKVHGCPECGKNGYNLVGKIYGELTVQYKNGHDRFGKVLWRCKCSCGKKCDVSTQGLTSGDYKTCGHNKGNRKTKAKLKGLVINDLTVLKYVGKSTWKCRCKCGNITYKHASDLESGRAVSCGKCVTQIKDITGQKFGALTALELAYTVNGRAYWKCECECGKIRIVNGKDLRGGKIYACSCGNIAFNGSVPENEIKNYIVDNLPSDIITKDHKILKGKEIDIFIPEKNLGIEYNGSPFHASLNNVYSDKPKLYHQQKFLVAKEQGVHLISIFDVDWQNNQEKIKMYLDSLILPQEKLFARKCRLGVVDNDIAVDFVNKYHLQGANKATMKINYGLYQNDELMAVMSFGRLRLAKHEEGEYELHRYCVRDGYTVLGGAERLLKAFEREYKPKYIVSYSDNDYFLGAIYERLKFDNVGQSTPRYYWYLNGEELRREQCMLKHLRVEYPELLQEAINKEAKNKEDYVMTSLGACKVYRSGNTKWEKRY